MHLCFTIYSFSSLCMKELIGRKYFTTICGLLPDGDSMPC
uniref:Uncharacterized protein n=1 Tax=Arundo donax TaxID=35708 RepID=A0A0A9EKJ3_ARUDO